MPKLKGQVLGILVSSADDRFESALLRGLADVVWQAGGSWICFTSGAIRSHRGFEFQRNILYDLVNEDAVNGLVVSGTLGHVVQHDELLAFCRSYAPLPLTTIAVGLEGFPKVLNNSFQGIKDVVSHLVDVHKYKNIGFLRGPMGHQEADERLRAFLGGMKDSGRSESELLGWVGEGEYTFESGREAMKQLLDRSLPLDAVISSNDSMALGAMEVLRERGLRIPQDIAITGFDDTDEGRQSLPPLTSVYQSVYDLGKNAAEMLLAGLNGLEHPDTIIIPPALIIRQSCGCPEQRVLKAELADERVEPLGFASAAIREKVVNSMAQSVSALLHQDLIRWMTEIHDAFIHDLKLNTPAKFLEKWKEVIWAGQQATTHAIPWHDALSAMRGTILPTLSGTPFLQKAESFWQQARVFVSGELLKVETSIRLQAEHRSVVLREISESMMTCHTLAELLDTATFELPRLGIHACYLALFDRAAVSTETARLVFAFDGTGRYSIAREGIPFQSRNLLPDTFLRELNQFGLVAEALYSREHRLGFMLLEVDAENAMVCSAIRGVLSNALQGVILEEQRNEAEGELRHYQRDLEKLVEERTTELRSANQKLEAEIRERLLTEAERERLIVELEKKNAELERFAYTASHDLKSPIITIRGFLGHLELDAASGNTVRLKQDIQRISAAADKMYELLNDLLELSRIGRVLNPPEIIDFNALVESALQLIHGRLKENDVDVRVTSTGQQVFGDRSRLIEVLQNLLDNSAKFTLGRKTPTVVVGCSGTEGDKFIFYVRDNGIGIAPEHHERIFGLFNKLDVTIEGTGVGLALVKRIIELHDGRIWVESELGEGSTFYFTLPKAVI